MSISEVSAAMLLLASAVGPSGGAEQDASRHRPNLILLMTDQHRADCVGADGNRVIVTPNLDRLAREGLVKAPRGQVLSQPVELRDVLPTLLDAAGVSYDPQWFDGRSMLELVRGRTQGWREWIDLEHSTCYAPENNWTGATDGRVKYIYYAPDGREQLFDLVKDPQENRNLAGLPEHRSTLLLWRERLIRHLSERGEPFVVDGKLGIRPKSTLYSPQYPRDELPKPVPKRSQAPRREPRDSPHALGLSRCLAPVRLPLAIRRPFPGFYPTVPTTVFRFRTSAYQPVMPSRRGTDLRARPAARSQTKNRLPCQREPSSPALTTDFAEEFVQEMT